MSETKHCARCGASFGCGRNDADCWCTHLPPLPAGALAAGTDCYCPACLQAIVAAQASDTPAREDPAPRD